jgi:hypothetical protein
MTANTPSRFPAHYTRGVAQYVLPLPTNGKELSTMLDEALFSRPGLEFHRIKVSASDEEIVLSVPIDWRTEDERRQ